MEQNTSRESFRGTGEHRGKYLVETTETNSNFLARGTEIARITPDDFSANDETFPNHDFVNMRLYFSGLVRGKDKER